MKPERFTACVFTFVIGALMLSAVFGFASNKINHDEETPGQKIKIEWEKIYPFEISAEEMPAKDSPLVKLYEHVKERLESYTSKEMPGYYSIVESAKKYEDVLGWNMVPIFDYNAVIRLKDGYLTSYTPSLDVRHDAESVKGLADFCADRGIDFAYINFPTKICVSEDKEISGTLDFANQNADRLLAMLKDSGVRNYDFRENLHFSAIGGGYESSRGVLHHRSSLEAGDRTMGGGRDTQNSAR